MHFHVRPALNSIPHSVYERNEFNKNNNHNTKHHSAAQRASDMLMVVNFWRKRCNFSQPRFFNHIKLQWPLVVLGILAEDAYKQ